MSVIPAHADTCHNMTFREPTLHAFNCSVAVALQADKTPISHSLGLTAALCHTHWASLLPYVTLTGPHYCPISHSLGLTTALSHTHWASLLLYLTLAGPHYCSMSLSLAGALLFKYLQHIESVGVKEAKKKKAKLLATAAKVLHYTTHSTTHSTLTTAPLPLGLAAPHNTVQPPSPPGLHSSESS